MAPSKLRAACELLFGPSQKFAASDRAINNSTPTADSVVETQQQMQPQQPQPRLLGSGRYAVLRSLGSGSGGEALLCSRWPVNAADPGDVVVKQVQISSLGEKERSEALNEARVMQELVSSCLLRATVTVACSLLCLGLRAAPCVGGPG